MMRKKLGAFVFAVMLLFTAAAPTLARAEEDNVKYENAEEKLDYKQEVLKQTIVGKKGDVLDVKAIIEPLVEGQTADIVFAVDGSGSTSGHQAAMREGLKTVGQSIISRNPKTRIGLVDLDKKTLCELTGDVSTWNAGVEATWGGSSESVDGAVAAAELAKTGSNDNKVVIVIADCDSFEDNPTILPTTYPDIQFNLFLFGGNYDSASESIKKYAQRIIGSDTDPNFRKRLFEVADAGGLASNADQLEKLATTNIIVSGTSEITIAPEFELVEGSAKASSGTLSVEGNTIKVSDLKFNTNGETAEITYQLRVKDFTDDMKAINSSASFSGETEKTGKFGPDKFPIPKAHKVGTPDLAVTKTVDTKKVSKVGKTVNYVVTIENKGTMDFHIDAVKDVLTSKEGTVKETELKPEKVDLKPGDKTEIKYNYKVTEDDLKNDFLENKVDVKATALNKAPLEKSASAKVDTEFIEPPKPEPKPEPKKPLRIIINTISEAISGNNVAESKAEQEQNPVIDLKQNQENDQANKQVVDNCCGGCKAGEDCDGCKAGANCSDTDKKEMQKPESKGVEKPESKADDKKAMEIPKTGVDTAINAANSVYGLISVLGLSASTVLRRRK